MVQYDKDYMRIKFESNDNLATDNIINIHLQKLLEMFLLKVVNFILNYF